MELSGFEILFSKNVPHILEKIFLFLDYESGIMEYFPGILHVLCSLALVRLGRESVDAAEVQGDVALGVIDVVQADETPGRLLGTMHIHCLSSACGRSFVCFVFTCGGARRSISGTFSFFFFFFWTTSPPLTVWQQKSHKRVWNENLEFLMRSAVCLLSAVCLFISY